MALLIDGYNLVHIAGFLPRGVGPGTLEASRRALLNFVAQAVESDQLARTTVVFDAKDPPPGLPKTFQYRGITVWFSTDFEDADELIEQLIRRDSAPRSLTVVSSDHRLQRAARRRRAVPIDSDRWFHEMVARRRTKGYADQLREELRKPTVPSSPEEVQRWLDAFGEIDHQAMAREIADEASSSAERTEASPEDAGRDKKKAPPPSKDKIELPGNPFPPGYGEDLLE